LIRAVSQGKQLGRPMNLTKQQATEVVQKLNEGAPVGALAREYRTSRQSITRIRQVNIQP
jgi:putative DNA-invertase from lambdoid prophage Rac